MSCKDFRWILMGTVLIVAASQASVFGGQKESAGSVPAMRALLIKPTTLDYNASSVFDAIHYLQDKTQLPFHADREAFAALGIMQDVPMILQPGEVPPPPNPQHAVPLKGTSERLDKILRRGLKSAGLTYVLLNDGILITTENYVGIRLARQRLDVQVEDKPCSEALRDLAKRMGVNLVIDPRVLQKANLTKVSLDLSDTTVDTACRLLAEFVDLKAVWMHDVLFLTDAARATRIRAEESAPQNPQLFPGALPIDSRPFIFGGGAQEPAALAPAENNKK